MQQPTSQQLVTAEAKAHLGMIAATEHGMARIRLLALAVCTLGYLSCVDEERSHPWLASGILLLSWAAGIRAYLRAPSRPGSILLSGYCVAAGQAVLNTLWLYATGGYHSPFYVLIYVSMMALAVRYPVKQTMVAAVIHGSSYLALLAALGQVSGHVGDIAIRIAFVFVIAAFSSTVSRELSSYLRERAAADEQARTAASRNLAAIVEASSDAILSVGMDGRILAWNSGAERVYGYTAEEILGQSVSLLAPEDRKGEVRGILDRILEGKSVVNFETVRRTKDGRLFHAAITVSPLHDSTGTLIGTATISRDISDRKRGEQQIMELNAALSRRAAELQAANSELEAFCYSVSHDLRSPLRAIDGFSHALAEDYAAVLGKAGLSQLDRVRQASQRMAQLIDDLLALAQMARSTMRIRTCELSEMAHETVHELARREPEREVEVIIAPGLEVQADPGLLKLVLANLLGNAWKFTARQPHARIELGVTERDGRPAYFVRDNGAGFDMAYASKLFGPFQRLHAVHEFAGTGIGLATVKRIVTRHGGQIWAEGKVGQGATFTFTLS